MLTRTIFDRADRTIAVMEDNTAVTSFAYDGAHRQIQSTDALGNVVLNTFDANNNVIISSREEVCTITSPTVANEIFSTIMAYDSLNHLVVRAEQGADGSLIPTPPPCVILPGIQTKVSVFGFDSRGNQCLAVDPNGDSTLTVFDGASRELQTQSASLPRKGTRIDIVCLSWQPAFSGVEFTLQRDCGFLHSRSPASRMTIVL